MGFFVHETRPSSPFCQSTERLVLGADCLTVINYKDKELNIYVTTDASDRCTGAILSFGKTWETARPVVYKSYQLNNAEKNYPTHEKELLMIVKALKKMEVTPPLGLLRDLH